MAENDQYEELQKRVEALTKRVYNLEVQAGLRASQSASSVRERREATAASLESRIGGHWLNRVGIIAVLLLMWGFFIIAAPRTFLSKEIYAAFMSTVPFYGVMALPVWLSTLIGAENSVVPASRRT